MKWAGRGKIAARCLAVAAGALIFFSLTAIHPPKAHAFLSLLADAAEEIGSWVVDLVKGGAKQAAIDALSAARGGQATDTIMDLIQKRDYVSALGLAGIMVLKWVSDLLKIVNDVVFGFIFGDLLMLIDYKKLPGDAGKHVNHLYSIMTYVGEALAFFFFILSQGLLMFKLSSKRAWKDLFIHIRRFAAVLILIPFFPYLFSLSLSLTAIISDKIMSEKIKGELIRHAPGGQILDGSLSFSSPATGLDQLGGKIDYYLNLPDTIVDEAVTRGREAVSTAISSVQDGVNQAIDNTVNKTIDNTVGKGIDAIAKKFGIDVVSGTDGGSSGPIKTGVPSALIYAVVGYIINAIIEITSLTLSLGLLTMKGFQLAALLLLYIAAPLILAFMVLPMNDNMGIKLFKTCFSLLGWNIIWALGIKIYGIVGLLANIINAEGGAAGLESLLGYGVAGVLPFAGTFMKLGALLIMTGVSGWVGIVAASAIGAVSAGAATGLLSLGNAMRLAGGVASIPSRITSAAGAASVGLANGFGRTVGAIQNPAAFAATVGAGLAAKTSALGSAFKKGVEKSTGTTTRERMVKERMDGQGMSDSAKKAQSPSRKEKV